MRPAIESVTILADGRARVAGPLGAGPGDGPAYFWVRVALQEGPDEDGPEAVGADDMTKAQVADAAADAGGGMWWATVPVRRGPFEKGNVFVAAWALVYNEPEERLFEIFWYDEEVPLTVEEETRS